MKDPFRESTLPGFVILFIGANMIAALAAIVASGSNTIVRYTKNIIKSTSVNSPWMIW